MRDTLAPLITPKTKVYQDLKAAIFDEKRAGTTYRG
jgi:hypothetical protein